jgi:Fe-S-cluster containining protein
MGETPEAIRTYLRERGGPEGAQIADMVVPLRAMVPGSSAPDGRIIEVTPEGGGWIFTCKNFEAETGNCLIYAMRPKYMCGSFPYGNPCEHGENCTWSAGRLGAWPLTFSTTVWRDGSDVSSRRWHLRVVQGGGRPSQELALSFARREVHREVGMVEG